MGQKVINLVKDDEWYTPKSLFDFFSNKDGVKFDYDPSTNLRKANEFGLKNYDTRHTNGLKRDWAQFQKIWINPPFTQKKEFLAKAQSTYSKNPNILIYVLLPIGFLTTKAFHDTVKGCKVYVPDGRIKFESGNDRKSVSPAFGSVIIKLQKNWSIEKFSLSSIYNTNKTSKSA